MKPTIPLAILKREIWPINAVIQHTLESVEKNWYIFNIHFYTH